MGKEKRKRDRTVSEADKGLKSQRLDGQAAAGKSLKSQGPQDVQAASSSDSSESSAETTSSSHSDGNDGWCHHMYLDSEEVDMDVFHINNSKELPTCRCLGCGITRKGAGESKEGMIQCIECYYSSCAGWLEGRENPRGHALLHAAHPKHHIAQWYDEQNLGYCFKCARSDTDNQDQSSNGGWPKVDRQVKDDRGMVASKTTDQRGMVARKTTDQQGVVDSKFGVDWEMVASNSKVHWEIVGSNAMDQRGMKARDDASGYATGDGYVIRGMPNYGNTCYMNASLQCLLALGKLRTKILSPDARLGDIGMDMKQLFVETSSENNAARHMLDPRTMLVFMQSLYPKWFKDREMRDSHEFLSSLGKALDNEVTELNQSHMEQGEEVFCTFGHSIFKVPSEDPPPPARSVAECGNSQIPVLDLGVGAIEEAPKPLQVDSCEVKDVVRGCLQTQKNDVPGDTIEVPMEVLRFLSNLFDDSEDIKGKNKKDARAYNALHKVDTHDDMEELVEISSTDMEILGIGQDSLSIDIPGQIDEYIYKAFQQTSIVRIISSRRKRPIKEIHIVPPPRLQLSGECALHTTLGLMECHFKVLYASRPNGPREFTVRLSHLHLGMLVRQFCESEEGRRLKGRDRLAVCLLMAKIHGVVSEEDFAAGCLPEAVRYRIREYHELSEMEMRTIPSFLEEAEMIATSFSY